MLVISNHSPDYSLNLIHKYIKKEKTIHLQILKSRNNLPYIKEKEIDIINSRQFKILKNYKFHDAEILKSFNRIIPMTA